jgi:hypothetical protein
MVLRPQWVGVVAVLVMGCGSDETTPIESPPADCPAGEWAREDGSCVPAGLPPDMPCPPGEWLREDGMCIPAGVPPDGCGEGFMHDGDRGCQAVLPAAPCPPGLMAVPGETVCREVAPCAPGTWGDIPVEPDTEYVDASYAGMDSDGSALKPWTSVQPGVDAASPGAIVAIAAGSYVEGVIVGGKRVRLWGVCPRLVEVVRSGGGEAPVVVFGGADGSEVRGLSLRGQAMGFYLSGSLDMLLERVWVHDNAGRGIDVESAYGPTGITIRGALVEQNHANGVFVAGPEATLESSVIRATEPDARGLYGRGVGVQAWPPTAAPSTLRLQGSVVEQNHDMGVFVEGSSATVEASVVRTTQPDAQGLFGRGVNVQADPTTGAPSTLSLQRSVVEQNHEHGVFVAGSEATVEASVVRATALDAEELVGRGVNVRADPTTGAPSTLHLQRSLVEENHQLGVFVEGSSATVDASVVRRTLPAHGFGRGVNVQADPTTGSPSTFDLQHSLVEQNHQVGVVVAGGEATIEASVVRETQPNVLGYHGRGVQVQMHPTTGTASTLLLESSLVEQSYEGGVYVIDADATLASCVVRDSLPNGDDRLGEGVSLASALGNASATIRATRIERSARAAVSTWGAHVAIGGSVLSCQAFDINYETYGGTAARLDDLGGNLCGCPEATAPCVGVTASLEPPPLIEPETP